MKVQWQVTCRYIRDDQAAMAVRDGFRSPKSRAGIIRYMNEKLENMKSKPVILVVLGPHRSGTSALTGVLSHLGANLPKHLMPANEGNSLGYFESSRVKTFNDGLLSKMGSSWSDISRLDLTSVHEQERENLLDQAVEILKAEFNDARTPILKDPRICRLVDFWRMAFDRLYYRPIYIHTHRNPLEAARSLAARHPISVEMGLLIWLRHVLDAEAATRSEPRAFTNYLALLENWRAQMSKIELATGFSFHLNTPTIQQEIDAFLNKGLRHQTHRFDDVLQSAQVADLVREAFEIFERWTKGEENPADYQSLDKLQANLTSAIGVISSFVQVLEGSDAQRKSLEAKYAQAECERSRLVAELDRLREDGASRAADSMAKRSEFNGELRQCSLAAEQLSHTNHQFTRRVEAAEAENLRLAKESDAEQRNFENEIRSRDDAIQSLKANVEECFRETAHFSEFILELDQKFGKERTQRVELEKKYAQVEVERSRLAAELDRLREDGASRAADYMAKRSEFDRELRQRNLEVQHMLDTNQQLMSRVESLKAENLRLTEESDAEQQRFENEIRSRDDAVQALEANVGERFREIARISENMLETSRKLETELVRRVELEEKYAQVEVERSRLAVELDRTHKEVEDMRVRVNALLASTSWRITGPLRRLVSLIRR